ncbi:hypothetical protein HYE04_00250 [Mycoplasmopsis bovis]|nr:hypothetical protein [Mycoplasmopsis bovis]QQH27722.1 hypothetical protein HYE04_00250 [Mycoplasmopsis bovis]
MNKIKPYENGCFETRTIDLISEVKKHLFKVEEQFLDPADHTRNKLLYFLEIWIKATFA